MNMQGNGLKSTRAEKLFYSLGDVGGNIVWSFSSAFLTLYYTDSAGLAAAFVGTMMLFCRIFDGLSDVAMGAIIDKTSTRWGKARSWVLFSTVPLALVFLAVYNVPANLGATGKNIYAIVTYFLLSVVCYTANNLAYHAMLPRFSLTSQDRSIVSAVRSIFSMVTIVAVNMVTPMALAKMGGEGKQSAWTAITLIYGGISVISLFIAFLGVKEKLPVDSGDVSNQKIPLNRAVKSLLSSRYFYIAVALFLIYFITSGASGIGIYYARDVLGNAGVFGIMSMISILPTLVIAPFVPLLFKRFGKRNTMLSGVLLSTAAAALMLINPRSTALYIVLSLVRTLGGLPLAVGIFTLAGDIVDYNDMKTGIRAEGIATAANLVGQKLGTGLGSALLGWSLAWGNYTAGLAAQPDSAISAMIVMAVIVPLVVFSIAFILLLFWNLDKYQGRIQDYLKNKPGAANA
jgi:GPH family glycoside/pentoside/hexuronide:cation symporter